MAFDGKTSMVGFMYERRKKTIVAHRCIQAPGVPTGEQTACAAGTRAWLGKCVGGESNLPEVLEEARRLATE